MPAFRNRRIDLILTQLSSTLHGRVLRPARKRPGAFQMQVAPVVREGRSA